MVLGNDGKVAEQGSYEELSARPDGAFTKLMEWQLSGADTQPPVSPSVNSEIQEKPWEVQAEEDGEAEANHKTERQG